MTPTDTKTMSKANLLKNIGNIVGDQAKSLEIKTWINTGLPPLNYCLSGHYDRGYALGRLYEMFGPSSSGKTLCATKAMIAAQEQGGCAIFIDYEQSFDLSLAMELGMTDEAPYFIYVAPRTWEEGNQKAIELAAAIRESEVIAGTAPIMIVQDSIAAAVPASQVAKGHDFNALNMNDTTALARVTSTTLKSIKAYATDLQFTCLFLNQIRVSPGVCLRGDVKIPFVDGTYATMQEIVRGKIAKDVWSFNQETGEFEAKPIVGWMDNGKVESNDEWVHIKSTGHGTKNGVKAVTATRDHQILTVGENNEPVWKEAQDIKVGDKLYAQDTHQLRDEDRDIFAGMILGDVSIKEGHSERAITANLTFQDSVDPDYPVWKTELLAPIFGRFNSVKYKFNGKNLEKWVGQYRNEIYRYRELRKNPLETFETFGLTMRGFLIWIMDDGHMADRDRYFLSIGRIKDDVVLDEIADWLYYNLGLRSRVRHRQGQLVFDAESSRKISRALAEYEIPKCMRRKILPADRGRRPTKQYSMKPANKSVVVLETVTCVCAAGNKNRGDLSNTKFDIEVADNHNFLAGSKDAGFVVHNSFGNPTVTPGGKATEFYASGRISLGRKTSVDKVAGLEEQEITAKVVKTKHTRPLKKCSWKLKFRDDGMAWFDTELSTIEFAKTNGLLETAGNYIVWEGKKYYAVQLAEHLRNTGTSDAFTAWLVENGKDVIAEKEEELEA